MKKLVLIFFFIFFINLFPQLAQSKTQTAILIQGFNNIELNGYGSSSLFNKPQNIISLNPSAVCNYEKMSLGISYQAESNIKEAYIAGIGYSRITGSTPESFGITYQYENFRIGIGFGQTYNGNLEFGPIAITTPEQPDGIGETFVPVFKTTIYSYGVTLGYTLNEFIRANDKFSVGIRLNRNVLHEYEQINTTSLDEKIYCTNFAAGINYYTSMGSNRELGIGLSYESAMEFSKYVTFNNSSDGLVTPQGTYKIDMAPTIITGKVPAKLKIDFDLTAVEKLRILLNISTAFWNNVSDTYKNQLDFGGSAVYSPAEFIDLSAGIFTITRKYSSGDMQKYFGTDAVLNATYLTAGIVLKYSGISLDLALADSNSLSDAWRKQTIFKAGLGYEL